MANTDRIDETVNKLSNTHKTLGSIMNKLLLFE